MAQGVPEKPELETRTFRPSSGAALTATGFVDDSTKQKQFAAGLSAFSNLLKKGGEFEQKRRVFNDKIIAQTAIQLGDKNPAFLTNEGQFTYNNMLADKAADDFLIKLNKHSIVQGRTLFEQRDANGNPLSFDARATGYNNILDTLITANASGLQFNNAQKTVYGQKVLAHKLKLLDEFQKTNIGFVQQDVFDTQSSAMVSDFRFLTQGQPPIQLDRDESSGHGADRKNISTPDTEKIIKDKAFGAGINKDKILEWDDRLRKLGVNQDERMKMFIQSLTIIGKETRNPRIFDVLNQNFRKGWNPATGRFAEEIQAAKTALNSEYRAEVSFRIKMEDHNLKKHRESTLNQMTIQAVNLAAADKLPQTQDGVDLWIKTNWPGIDSNIRGDFKRWWSTRVSSKLQTNSDHYKFISDRLSGVGGHYANMTEFTNELSGKDISQEDIVVLETRARAMFAGQQTKSEGFSYKRSTAIVENYRLGIAQGGAAVTLGSSGITLKRKTVVDIGKIVEDLKAKGIKDQPIELINQIQKRQLTVETNQALSKYQALLDQRIQSIYNDNRGDPDKARAEVEHYLDKEAGVSHLPVSATTERELVIEKEPAKDIKEEKEEVQVEPSGVPGKVKKTKSPKIASTSSETDTSATTVTLNPEEPEQKEKNQATATAYELSPTIKLLIQSREEYIETLHKAGAIELRDEANKHDITLGIPFVTPITEIFSAIEKGIPTAKEVVEGIDTAAAVVSDVVSDVREGIASKIPKTGEGSFLAGIKKLIKGERPTPKISEAAERFKKVAGLNVSNQEAQRIMKQGLIKKLDLTRSASLMQDQIVRDINILKSIPGKVADVAKSQAAAVAKIPGAIVEDVSAISTAAKQAGRQTQKALKETLKSVQEPVVNTLKSIKDFINSGASLQDVGKAVDKRISEEIKKLILTPKERIAKIGQPLEEEAYQAPAYRETTKPILTPGKVITRDSELKPIAASGAKNVLPGVKLEGTFPEVLALSNHLFNDTKLFSDLPDIFDFETSTITSGFRPARDSAHGHGKAIDIRLRGNFDASLITNTFHRSLKRAGYKILLTKDGKTSVTIQAAKGPQTWSRFIKDGKNYMMEIEKGKEPHLHIQLGDDFDTTRDIAKRW